jgi:hypothetical protein
VVVFAVGALGGMMSPNTEVTTHAEAARFGAELAAAVETALAGAEPHADPSVAFARAEVLVTLENPLYTLGTEMGLLPPVEIRDGSVVTEVSVARIGPAMLASVPGELLPKLGLRLKSAMRAAGATLPIVVGLADDELGYLLPAEDFTFPEDYLNPGSQYEESFSVGPTGGPRVVEALEALLPAVATSSPNEGGS